MKKTFLGLPEEPIHNPGVKAVIVPVPFEASVSYGTGTEKGPEAILNASEQIELFDLFLKDQYPESFFHTLEPLIHMDSYATMLSELYPLVLDLLKNEKFPIVLGGEHSVAIPAVKAFTQRYSGGTVIHLDAHADLRNTYNHDKWSHACVMRRIREFNLSTLSIGVRSCSLEEHEYITKNNVQIINPEEANFEHHITQALDNLSGPAWLTFDVDVFDPSLMPATGTPEPAGLHYDQIMEIFKWLRNSSLDFKGCDFVELSPVPGVHHADFTVAKTIHRLAMILL